MRRLCFLLRRPAVLTLTIAMAIAMASGPLAAQAAAPSHAFYDLTREVTFSGTVAEVLTKATAGKMLGAHLLLTTSFGPMDASLGRWGLQGKGAPSIRVGERVVATGVIKRTGEKQVFVVRSLTVGGRVYAVRNEHGIPIPPQARERAGRKATQKGELR